ncbi:MAG: twin transmembrane helix small protein [Arenicellales bacterium WSBS_2016_MAG_OTU3]
MSSTIVIVVLLIAMAGSLFSALYFMIKDKGGSNRTVKALTVRIGIWVVLFAILAIGLQTGWIEPSMSVTPRQ